MISGVVALLAATAAAAVSASPVSQATSPPAAAHAAPRISDSDAQNKIVCHTMVPTGSLLGGVRECKTRAQWSEDSRRAREATENQQASGFTGGGH